MGSLSRRTTTRAWLVLLARLNAAGSELATLSGLSDLASRNRDLYNELRRSNILEVLEPEAVAASPAVLEAAVGRAVG